MVLVLPKLKMFFSEKVTEKFTNLDFPDNLFHFYTTGVHEIYL